MKNKIVSGMSLFGTIGLVGGLAISCAKTSPMDNVGENIFIVKKNGATINGGEENFKKVMDLLKKSNTENSQQVSNIFNAAAKYLYNQEQKASEIDKVAIKDYVTYQNWSLKNSSDKKEREKFKKKNKNAKVDALETEAKIKKRVTANFNDSKEAFKNKMGVDWNTLWSAELAKSYSGAKNDNEAIENLIVKEMKANAYLRYKITKTTTKYTKGQLLLGRLTDTEIKILEKSSSSKDKLKAKVASQYQWLKTLDDQSLISSSNKNKTVNALVESDYITVVSTSSFIHDQKSPSSIIGGADKIIDGQTVKQHGYLNKFQPMFISHFLIKAVPNEKNRLSPWAIAMPDLKKLLYSLDGKNGMSKAIMKFKGVTQDAGTNKYGVSDEDRKMLELVSGNSGAKTSGGSLGLQDELDYVKGMTPGFSIPILNNVGNTPLFEENTTINPMVKLSEKLITALSKMDGNTPIGIPGYPATGAEIKAAADKGAATSDTDATKWQDYVDGLISTQDKKVVLSTVGRVFKDAFGDAAKYRSVIYKNGNTKIVLSKFGIHIIKINKIEKLNAEKTLIGMLLSDLERETDSKSPFFKVLKELNKYSSDQHLIVKGLMADSKFLDFLKTQKNFSATAVNNHFPNYDITPGSKDLIAINKSLKSFEDIFEEQRALEAVKADRDYIQKNLFSNELVKAKNWAKSINEIYDNALAVAKEGLV